MLYQEETQNAYHNFVHTAPVHSSLIKAYLIVKKACALSNYTCDLLSKTDSDAIIETCDELYNHYETYQDQFITSALQGGAGTSTNMNVNEVIATLANQKFKACQIHPINHVNLSQSTNDTYPTALRIALIYKVRTLATTLSKLQESLQKKETEFESLLKIGRTQLMDALPITLGQEFGGYAKAISRDRWRIYKVEERLRETNLGGTAIGTGLNAPLKYIYSVTANLQKLTGLGLARADYLVDATANADVFVEVSGLLKALSSNLLKISNDLRLMNSGPIGGFNEITLEAHQKGSTIMPGKVNPVICEMINQIAFRMIGADTSITWAASAGQFELNPYLPLIASELLNNLDYLIEGIALFDTKVIQTIIPHPEQCSKKAMQSYALAACFIDYLGYDQAAELAQKAIQENTTIQSLILKDNLLSKETVDQILNVHQMTQPGIPGRKKL